MEEPDGSRTAIRRPIRPTNLGPWDITETEPPTKDLGPNTYVADVQLTLHVVPLKTRGRAVTLLLPLDSFILAGQPCLDSLGEDTLSLNVT